MYKSLKWDLDEVFVRILTMHKPIETRYIMFFQAASKVGKEIGINISAEEMQKRWITSQSTNRPYETSTDVLAFEFNAPYEQVYHRMHELLIEDHIHNFKADMTLAEEVLKLAHLDNYLVTHSNELWTNYWLNEMNLTNFFKGHFNVKSMGFCKYNDDGTYPKILELTNKSAEVSIMIDDSERNLVPAAKTGMKPILYSTGKSKNGYERHSCPIKLTSSILKQTA